MISMSVWVCFLSRCGYDAWVGANMLLGRCVYALLVDVVYALSMVHAKISEFETMMIKQCSCWVFEMVKPTLSNVHCSNSRHFLVA